MVMPGLVPAFLLLHDMAETIAARPAGLRQRLDEAGAAL
jgi:hypothetical protein